MSDDNSDSDFDLNDAESGDDGGHTDNDMDSIVGSDGEVETVYTTEVKEMLTVYERKVRVKASLATKGEILRLVRRLVLPCEKFIAEGTHIGSFDRPDFTDKKNWYSVVLNKAGFDNHKPRTLAKVWVTYRKDIAEAFSNHQSYVTVSMKKAFMGGKSFCSLCQYPELHLTCTF